MSEFLRIGEVAKAAGVSVDTLRRWESEGRVTFARHGNQRVLAVEDLPRLIDTVDEAPTTSSSARNRLSGLVLAVERDGVSAKVELLCGEYRITSLMTREAADALDLRPGVRATAVVKATNVIVEK